MLLNRETKRIVSTSRIYFQTFKPDGGSVMVPRYSEGYNKKKKKERCYIICLVWLFVFYGISTFVGYLTPNPFLCK